MRARKLKKYIKTRESLNNSIDNWTDAIKWNEPLYGMKNKSTNDSKQTSSQRDDAVHVHCIYLYSVCSHKPSS